MRRLVIAEQGGTCDRCSERDGLELHHLTYERLGQERRSDVVALCKEHHRTADRKRERDSAFRTWHTKKYGEDAEVHDFHVEEFDSWLERKQEW